MSNTEAYHIGPVVKRQVLSVPIPGSKSITNRVLLISALAHGNSHIRGVLYSDDSRALIAALRELGIAIVEDESHREVCVTGCNGRLPIQNACVTAHSAGTAARFLTALLAFSDGEFVLTASEQMKKRPMEPLIHALRTLGITILPLEQLDHLPLRIYGSTFVTNKLLPINIEQSTQFLSALMMTGVLLKDGLCLEAYGSRSALSYVRMTEHIMADFSVTITRSEEPASILAYHIPGGVRYLARDYCIEPDVSGACYFYAAAALLGISVTVPMVTKESIQGDLRFIEALVQLGCTVTNSDEGICVTGPSSGHFPGIDICMTDFSDQTMTMAVLAMFADSPTHIRKVAHIRHQECDRMLATITEINRLGGNACLDQEETGLIITPTDTLHAAQVETYHDHRMAMAFSLAGLRILGIRIDNPQCVKKTFENYFELFTKCFQ